MAGGGGYGFRFKWRRAHADDGRCNLMGMNLCHPAWPVDVVIHMRVYMQAAHNKLRAAPLAVKGLELLSSDVAGGVFRCSSPDVLNPVVGKRGQGPRFVPA